MSAGKTQTDRWRESAALAREDAKEARLRAQIEDAMGGRDALLWARAVVAFESRAALCDALAGGEGSARAEVKR